MKSQRLDMIEEYVLEHKNASLDTLCEKFNVSKKHHQKRCRHPSENAAVS